MNRPSRRLVLSSLATAAAVPALSAFAQQPRPAARPGAHAPARDTPVERWRALDRLSWGANAALLLQTRHEPVARWLDRQLEPASRTPLPAAVQARIDALTIARAPLAPLVRAMARQRRALRDGDGSGGDDATRQVARAAYRQAMDRLEREAATRHLLRARHSPNQLHEQMCWFWLNHFSVYARKADLRAMVADFEESALRPHALGRFRDLLGAATLHPAMLRYLDNAQNAAHRVNENHARELMELHTLGQGGGYGQQDVQELARVLTGVGIARMDDNDDDAMPPRLPRALQPYHVRRGLFEFDPRRHDFGSKTFLGAPIRSQGLAETDEALDRLARAPATARFIARKLARWWVADDPPPALVERAAQTFSRSDGDIAQVLRTLLTAPGFAAAAGRKFKDPMRYLMSALRLCSDDADVLDVEPVLRWLERLGEPLYGRQTPDGWPLDGASWASAAQLETRFEIAKAIGAGRARGPSSSGPQPARGGPARIDPGLFEAAIAPTLGAATRGALEAAATPQEWVAFLLSSPEFMRR